jgi:hypothetical protein
MILGGGGYIIYKTFIAKPPYNGRTSSSQFGSFADGHQTDGINTISQPIAPIKLTPEQKEIIKKQHEAFVKKRQGRLDERKGVLQQLGESPSEGKNKDNAAKDNKDNIKNESQKGAGKEKQNPDDNSDNTKGKDANTDEFVELSQVKNPKESSSAKETKDSSNTKDTFEKLKKLHLDKTSKKIAQLSGSSEANITPALSKNNNLSDTAALKLFGELDRNTLMSGVFKEVLSDLLQSKKLTKENASKILFEYMDKGLLNKGEVAKISSELKII